MSQVLTKKSLDLLKNYFKRQSTLNNVDETSVSQGLRFTIAEEVERNWVNNLRRTDPFISEIDIDLCTSQIVNDLEVDDLGLVSGRTNTKTTNRETTATGNVDGFSYTAVETTHDTHITFDALDKWAQEPDKFQLQVKERRLKSKVNDLLKIGWNGTNVAATTDKNANPLGEDVNIGWLQRIRDNAPEQVIDGSESEALVSGEISIGATNADFKNLDALVNKIMIDMIPKQHHRDLKVYVSIDLLGDRMQKLIEKSTVTEIGTTMTQTAYYIVNGLVAITPDYFPNGTVLVTYPKNIKHRTQKQSVRSSYEINSKRSRLENYNSANEFYGLGNYQAVGLVENIKIKA